MSQSSVETVQKELTRLPTKMSHPFETTNGAYASHFDERLSTLALTYEMHFVNYEEEQSLEMVPTELA